MGGSRRMRMELPTATSSPPLKLPKYPHRLSDATSDRRQKHLRQNFTEVLSRQSFTGLTKSSSSPDFFYEEMFRPEKAEATRRGRSLREFVIPGKTRMSEHINQESYENNNDFYGCDNERSKMSSSFLNSNEFSPLPPPTVSGEDYDSVSSFASELIRQINVKVLGHEDLQGQQKMPAFNPINNYNTEYKSNGSYSFGINPKNEYQETIIHEEISNYSCGVSTYDLELNSPSSTASQSDQEDEDEEKDEIMSSYNFIKSISSDDNKERRCESNGVDEAIAWVKQCSK